MIVKSSRDLRRPSFEALVRGPPVSAISTPVDHGAGAGPGHNISINTTPVLMCPASIAKHEGIFGSLLHCQ